jgi:hypothetical protein
VHGRGSTQPLVSAIALPGDLGAAGSCDYVRSLYTDFGQPIAVFNDSVP